MPYRRNGRASALLLRISADVLGLLQSLTDCNVEHSEAPTSHDIPGGTHGAVGGHTPSGSRQSLVSVEPLWDFGP